MATSSDRENTEPPQEHEDSEVEEAQQTIAPPAARKPVRQTYHGRSFLKDLLSETVLGYVFWSVLHGFAPMVWFYPLNLLEISGYEALGLVWLAPILCSIKPLFSALQTRTGLFLLRALVVGSVASFQAPTTLTRLIILTVGNFALTLLWCATWWHKTSHQRLVTFWGTILGFLVMLASRIWYVSINPAWSDVTSNTVVITLGAIATLERYFSVEYPKPEPKPNETIAGYWKLVGVAFGSLVYITHWVFGEVSVVTRWSVTGLPFSGPHPFPAGAAVFLEIITGFLLSTKPGLPTNFLWIWFVGGHTALGFYYISGFFSFACGLLFSLFIMSIWPEMSDRLTSCPPAKTLTVAMATYLLQHLFLVWTVAFNFVPGGWYTRERSLALLIFGLFMIGRALMKGTPRDTEKRDCKHIGFTDLDGTGAHQAFGDVKIFVIVIALIGIAGFAYRLPARRARPIEKANPKEFTSLIWTAHFMYDNEGWPSYERVGQMLEDTGADVITLLESDASKPFLGHNDISMWLGERLGMYDDFGPSTSSHTWGNLLLSRYPILTSQHHLLPSPEGELAPAISATVNISGSLVDFVVTHMGNDGDDTDRKLQAEYLANITRKSKNPVVFMGHVNSGPESREYKKFVKYGKLKDIDATDKERFCEYIMYRDLKRVGYARISHGGLSDTEIQMAKFEIPENRKDYEDNDAMTTNMNEVDESIRFSSKFGGIFDGHYYGNKHHYHMGTPKYFTRKRT